MAKKTPLVRNISDTAFWVAVYRAYESEKRDALFKDPYARQLAGKRGEEIAGSSQFLKRMSWPFIARTWLFDKIIRESIDKGIDVVINLAAGLDTRPYRLTLPSSLKWVEVDLPDLLNYKKEILRDELPNCQLERVPADLSDQSRRRKLFEELSSHGKNILILTEGLIVYLDKDEVANFAADLSRIPQFQNWALDIASPPLLSLMQKQIGGMLDDAGAPLKFAPAKGTAFFKDFDWEQSEVYSMFKTAGKIKRLPWPLRFFAMLPEREKDRIRKPWSGVCVMNNSNLENY